MEEWFIFLGCLFSIITAIGNGFVVIVITKSTRLHSSANWLVLFLAVADFGVGVAFFPSGYLCSKIACNMRIYMALYSFFIHSSVTNLCALTWDRYTAIVHPFKYITCVTARHPKIAIFIAWLIPLVISMSLVLGMYATNSHTAWKILRLAGVSVFDMLACLFLFFCVARILFVARVKADTPYVIRRTAASIELQEQQNQSSIESISTHRHKRPNTALFLIAIVTFFLVCHAVINYLVLYITFYSKVSNLVPAILTLLLVINSAVNPLVYAFLKRDIKTELKFLILRENRRNGNSHSERSTQML